MGPVILMLDLMRVDPGRYGVDKVFSVNEESWTHNCGTNLRALI